MKHSRAAVAFIAALVVALVVSVLAVAPASAASATGTLSIDDVEVQEGNTGTTSATFTITLDGTNPIGGLQVAYETSDGSATSPEDYAAREGTVTFGPGQKTRTVTVPVAGDTQAEPNETFTVTISKDSPLDPDVTVSDATGEGTIINDDGLSPALTIADATALEGESGTTVVQVPVQLSAASTLPVSVDYTTVDGTATAPGDYTAIDSANTLVIPAGDTQGQITVSVAGDSLDEIDETFTVTLSDAHNATISDSSGSVTITDDDAAPTVSVLDADPVAEGDAAVGPTMTFEVTLSAPSGREVQVDYTTVAGTATADVDYVAEAGIVTFAAGDVSQDIDVTVIGDDIHEPNETLGISLSDPRNTTIEDGTASGTINDDESLSASIDDVDVLESDGTADFTVTLSMPSSSEITIDYTTQNGTAFAGQDYTAVAGKLVFPAGTTTQPVEVPITADTADDADAETFTVALSNPTDGVGLSDASGIGTITDDDDTPTLSIDDVGVAESAGTATFTVTLSQPSNRDVTVHLDTTPDTATAGSDYIAQSVDRTISAGSTTATLDVPINDDSLLEEDETFTVDLSNAQAATIAVASGIGTIDDDDQIGVSIDDASAAEGNAGTSAMDFTVTLDTTHDKTIQIDWETADGSATAGEDYTADSGTVTFVPGDTSETLSVQILGDTAPEPDDTFSVVLTVPAEVFAEDDEAIGTITDDDAGAPPAFSVEDASVSEGDAPATPVAVFDVVLDKPSTLTTSFDYTTADDTARAGFDYVAKNGTVTFAPGTTTSTIEIAILPDDVREGDETFALVFSNASNATEPADATGTIVDDEPVPTVSIGDASANEGDGTPTLSFTITLSGVSDGDVTVQYATSDGTATSPADYTAESDTAIIPAGSLTTTVTISVVDDAVHEGSEAMTVTITGAQGATTADGTGTGTITSDDAEPAVSIGDQTVMEGDSGTTPAAFTVTLSAASEVEITVKATTVAGTATAPSDFTTVSQTLTFVPGTTSMTVSVPVVGDTTEEADETYSVALSEPTNADLGDASGAGTIVDDDAESYVGLQPERLLDTRSDRRVAYFGSKPVSGQTVMLDVTGVGSAAVPDDAAAVVLNVTGVSATGEGFVTVYPCGSTRPLASTLNLTAGATVANSVIVKPGTSGRVCLYTSGGAHLVADISGYFPAGDAISVGVPERLLDTRSDRRVGYFGSKPVSGQTVMLDVTGVGSAAVPDDAAAVVLNVTGVSATGEGFVTVYPCGSTRPLASTLNLTAGATVANSVIVKPGTSGRVCLYTSGGAHLVADISGYFPAGDAISVGVPERLLDTRSDRRVGYFGSKPVSGQTVMLDVTGVGSAAVPDDAAAVVLNVTGVSATGEGFVTVYPCGSTRPLASTLNLTAGATVANSVIVKPGTSGRVCLYTSGGAHLIADISGYFPGSATD